MRFFNAAGVFLCNSCRDAIMFVAREGSRRKLDVIRVDWQVVYNMTKVDVVVHSYKCARPLSDTAMRRLCVRHGDRKMRAAHRNPTYKTYLDVYASDPTCVRLEVLQCLRRSERVAERVYARRACMLAVRMCVPAARVSVECARVARIAMCFFCRDYFSMSETALSFPPPYIFVAACVCVTTIVHAFVRPFVCAH